MKDIIISCTMQCWIYFQKTNSCLSFLIFYILFYFLTDFYAVLSGSFNLHCSCLCYFLSFLGQLCLSVTIKLILCYSKCIYINQGDFHKEKYLQSLSICIIQASNMIMMFVKDRGQ